MTWLPPPHKQLTALKLMPASGIPAECACDLIVLCELAEGICSRSGGKVRSLVNLAATESYSPRLEVRLRQIRMPAENRVFVNGSFSIGTGVAHATSRLNDLGEGLERSSPGTLRSGQKCSRSRREGGDNLCKEINEKRSSYGKDESTCFSRRK